MSIPINIIINNHTYYHKGNNKYIEILKEQAKPYLVSIENNNEIDLSELEGLIE